MNEREKALSVSQLNQYVKTLMESDSLLSSVSVIGEISNLKYHTSGHIYFTLKDAEAEMAAVMFRSSAAGLRFTVKNGMRVTAYGRVSMYEKSGKCQIYVSAMVDGGVGALQMEYERLFRRLSEEGLFSEERKRPLPHMPNCIGIVTSPTGAAVRDMINVTGRRWPMAKILIYPSLVQGAEAPASLCAALSYLNAAQACDVIIIGRGGGSIEDLWAFNDEGVVRAIAASRIPVISAVGHETDYTLSDFAADKRAPTPSAAAELAVPDKNEIKQRVDDVFSRSENAFLRVLTDKRTRVDALSKQIELSSPMARAQSERRAVEHARELMERSVNELCRRQRDRLSTAVGMLEAINPLSVLGRGYSITRHADGGVVTSVKALEMGERVTLTLCDGEADAEILDVRKKRKKRACAKENGNG